jgi:hypothetical protein
LPSLLPHLSSYHGSQELYCSLPLSSEPNSQINASPLPSL